MKYIVGVRLTPGGRIYSFITDNKELDTEDLVVVETVHGLKIGEVAEKSRDIREDENPEEMKPVIRIATDRDFEDDSKNIEKAKYAFERCKEKVAELGLEMKLFKAEYALDGSRVVFSYAAEARVDFRTLVKEMASILKTKIEMLQIGPREYAKVVGGMGTCGRVFCCQAFKTGFDVITIKTAKDQGLNTNPTKFSGNCGKLLCCLKHELAVYEHAATIAPKNNEAVKTPEGEGNVVAVNMLKETCTVRILKGDEAEVKSFTFDEITMMSPEEKMAFAESKQMAEQAAREAREAQKKAYEAKMERKNANHTHGKEMSKAVDSVKEGVSKAGQSDGTEPEKAKAPQQGSRERTFKKSDDRRNFEKNRQRDHNRDNNGHDKASQNDSNSQGEKHDRKNFNGKKKFHNNGKGRNEGYKKTENNNG